MIGRLGRRPHDPAQLARLPRLSAYQPPAAPEVVDWSLDLAPGVLGMLANDQVGDCTAAAALHAAQLWRSYRPPMRFATDTDAIALYGATGGYVAGDPTTDNGARCLDVLNYWRASGIACGGETARLSAFCALDPHHRPYVRAALWCFGCLYVGLTLHQAQQTEAVWSDVSSPIWGGHCVLIVAADDGGLTCITWGEKRRMTWGFWEVATDEAYGLLSPSWLASGRAPQGFPIAALMQDMAAVRVVA